ncbi:MAG: rhodanese-like domain-containing protein [Chitinophagales bacterium]
MNKSRFQDLPPIIFLEKAEQQAESVLIDVRTPTEYNEASLEEAVNINIKHQDFVEEINELDKNQHYFVYCSMGIRSVNACNYMAMLGFKNLYNLKGGLAALETTKRDK